MAARNPASVLPEPVGAQTSACWPATIAGQPPACASVGPSGNRRSNHTRTAGWNRSRIPGTPETANVDGGELTDTSASHQGGTGRLHPSPQTRSAGSAGQCPGLVDSAGAGPDDLLGAVDGRTARVV